MTQSLAPFSFVAPGGGEASAIRLRGEPRACLQTQVVATELAY